MIKNKFSGLFIAFEGLDGSGSSTQVDLLKDQLCSLGYPSFTTKEPTNNIVGGLIRGLLTKEWQTTPEGFQLLFAADRAHHLKSKVIPMLEKGSIVITDRYAFSTIAFGSIDLDKKWLLELNKHFILPDITFLIKCSPTECLNRINKSRHGREFFEEEKKLKKVWRTYDLLSQDKNYNMVVIDGEKNIEEISLEILNIVIAKIKELDAKRKR